MFRAPEAHARSGLARRDRLLAWAASLLVAHALLSCGAGGTPAASSPSTPPPGGGLQSPAGDAAFAGAWRVFSATLFFDAGGSTGAGDATTVSRRLQLAANGTWEFGTSRGRWAVAPVAAADWARWGIASYGPTRKVTLQGWAGGDADGPVEEAGGRVDFFWVLYRAAPPTVSAPGIVHMKFGHP